MADQDKGDATIKREHEALITSPREDLGVEYKGWLDLSDEKHKAKVAKAAMALANHGGGFIVLGMAERGSSFESEPAPVGSIEITQDLINGVVKRYATVEFHCRVYMVTHPGTNVVHPIIDVPGDLSEPVLSKRDCEKEIIQSRCYIRKPGPKTEEALTPEEWRTLLRRCVTANRSSMLDAIRSIVSGTTGVEHVSPSEVESLKAFCSASHDRWREIVSGESSDASSRFLNGFYEMGFSLIGLTASPTLSELNEKLSVARRIKYTGWTPFLSLTNPVWAPYPHQNEIEAWAGAIDKGRAKRSPSHCDFWRVSNGGKLYTIRGYSEDSLDSFQPGEVMDIALPIWRVGEALLFALRLSDALGGCDAIAIQCRFTGLNGRALASVSGYRERYDDVSRTDEITLTAEVTTQQVRDNLTEVLFSLLAPLYERFDFYSLSQQRVTEELSTMTKGGF